MLLTIQKMLNQRNTSPRSTGRGLYISIGNEHILSQIMNTAALIFHFKPYTVSAFPVIFLLS